MSATKHTPGEWELVTVRTSAGICHKIGPFPGTHGREVGHACIYDDYPGGERSTELLANAVLMKAAPDLLAALRAFVDYFDQAGIGPCEEDKDDEDDGTAFDGDSRFNVRLGRAAIAKATGAPSP